MKTVISTFLMALFFVWGANAQLVYTVTNTNNEGVGSLRDVLDLADADGVASLVTFDASLMGSTIVLESRLTMSDDSTTIDGDIDDDGNPDIGLDGVDRSFDGFRINGDYSRIEGLIVSSFFFGFRVPGTSDGIVIFRCTIKQNTIGISTNATSTTISQNSITGNINEGISSPLGNGFTNIGLSGEEMLVGEVSSNWIVEVFTDTAFQAGEYLGTVTADENGEFQFDLSGFDLEGLRVSATATDPLTGGTSEIKVAGGNILRKVDVNRWSCDISDFGSFAFNIASTDPGGEFPDGTGNFLIFAGGIYVGALKDPLGSSPELRYSVSHFEFTGDFTAGRILNDGVPLDQLQYETLTSGLLIIDTSMSGSDWDFWPFQKGAPGSAFGTPRLVSDQDSWTVFNDVDLDNHDLTETPIPGLGVEIQQATYAFTEETLPGAGDAVFIKWRIINHTDVVYDSASFGVWSDPDVGDASNDLMGTDTVRNMVLMYNSNAENTPTGKQYAVGYKLLYFSDDGGASAKISNSTHYLNGTDPRDPQSDTERFFYMSGRDRDGSIRLASEGFVEEDGSPFVFPGDPVTGTGLTASSRHPGGSDMRMLLNIGPFQMLPGQPYDVIFAIIGGEADDRLSAITSVRTKADGLETIFANIILPAIDFDGESPGVTMGVLQNPEESLSGYLDILIAADEQLADIDLEFTLNSADSSLDLVPVDNSDNVYSSDLTLEETGTLSFTLNIVDLGGNPTSLTRSFSISKVSPDGAATAVSLDGNVSVYIPKNTVADELYLLIGEEANTIPSDRYEPFSRSYLIGPRNYKSSVAMTLSIELEPREIEEVVNLGIYRLEDGVWNRVGGTLHEGRLVTEVTEFGIYRALYDRRGVVPIKYALHQNYPNPFNPSTSIRYELAEDAKVTLTIYNVLGQKVRDLVEGFQQANSYEIQWDGKNESGSYVSSGMYLYRLKAGDFVKTRKMMLIR